MKLINLLSKFILGLVIFIELGAVLYNLKEGYSAFYLFDISDKFSSYNNLFLIYWFAILGILFLAIDFIKRLDFFKIKYSSLIGEQSSYSLSQVKEFIKDYQILIGLIIIAFVLYQSSESELDTCINNLKHLYENSVEELGLATEWCVRNL